jgi:hypothetical protein
MGRRGWRQASIETVSASQLLPLLLLLLLLLRLLLLRLLLDY